MTPPQPGAEPEQAASAAFHCFRCQAPLTTGQRACPHCGQAFEAPVPAARPAPARSGQRRGVGVWIASGLAALVLAGIGFAGYRAVQNTLGAGRISTLPGQGRWSADPALMTQLGPEQQISGPLGSYAVRPPAGYTLQ